VYATSAALTHLRAVDRHEMKLSIPIPVYNFAEFLPQTLDSILSQEGVGQVEILVVDGASTDGTQQLIQPLCSQLSVPKTSSS
jgi:glycosyltransferase involved in cell wall biosynthesis